MKKLAVLLLAGISLSAVAQTKTSSSKTDDTKQSVSDNGKTLHILIKSSRNGKTVKYDHSFDVKGLNKQQKDALVKHINDSLGINPPPAPPAHH